jgi:hypothetical protein
VGFSGRSDFGSAAGGAYHGDALENESESESESDSESESESESAAYLSPEI